MREVLPREPGERERDEPWALVSETDAVWHLVVYIRCLLSVDRNTTECNRLAALGRPPGCFVMPFPIPNILQKSLLQTAYDALLLRRDRLSLSDYHALVDLCIPRDRKLPYVTTWEEVPQSWFIPGENNECTSALAMVPHILHQIRHRLEHQYGLFDADGTGAQLPSLYYDPFSGYLRGREETTTTFGNTLFKLRSLRSFVASFAQAAVAAAATATAACHH